MIHLRRGLTMRRLLAPFSLALLCGLQSIGNPSNARSESLPDLYQRQRQEDARTRSQVSRYCMATYRKAAYQATEGPWRYYVENGRLKGIGSELPSPDGRSCVRGSAPAGEPLNTKIYSTFRRRDLFSKSEASRLQLSNLDEVISVIESQIIVESGCIVRYSRDLKGSDRSVSRMAIACLRSNETPPGASSDEPLERPWRTVEPVPPLNASP